jgi:hypothetical protein
VDAFYYPNRNNLDKSERQLDVGSVEACRSWVSRIAAQNNDPQIRRGDYECGVGYLRDLGDFRVYRVTTRRQAVCSTSRDTIGTDAEKTMSLRDLPFVGSSCGSQQGLVARWKGRGPDVV